MSITASIKEGYTYFIYNILGHFFKKNPHLQIKIMNMGLALPPEKLITLLPEDEKERLQFQLYDYLISNIHINDKKVVEIGCGMGGGCYYVHTYYKPQQIVGIDLIKVNIQLATQLYKNLPITFVQGNACDLKYPDASFDVVINLESSHSYRSFQQFVQGVHRILVPGGYFLFSDLRYQQYAKELPEVFEKAHFKQLHTEDISAQVVSALAADNQRKAQLLNNYLFGKRLFKNMAFLEGSRYYKQLQNGEIVYVLYVLQKV